MPEICRFFGIVIQMFFTDHAPPHFHVRYGRRTASVGIDPLRLIEGAMPPRVLGMVFEWALLHQERLVENWELARAGKSPKRIPPLE